MNNDKSTGEGKSLAELAVQRRQEVRKKTGVSDAAKLLFDDLTDICFLSKHAVGFGVVRIGKPLLGERLGKSVPTITRAQKELARTEIWTRTGWHDGHEITIWFLRGIANGQLEFDQFTEGVTKRPQIRTAPRTESLRNGHGQFCKPPEPGNSLENDQLTVDLTGDYGQSRRGAPVNPTVGTPSTLTGSNGQNHQSGPVKFDRSERSNVTDANGQNHPIHPSNGDGGSTAGVTAYKKDTDIRNGEKAATPPPDKEFQQFLKSLEGLYPSRLHKLEKDLTLKFRAARSPEAKAEWKRRLEGVQNKLLGGPVDDKAVDPKPTIQVKPKMSPEEQSRLWQRDKRKLPADLRRILLGQQKAAATAAARSTENLPGAIPPPA